MNLAHHRHPWTPVEAATLVRMKRQGERHKVIARELQRTPRSVDQQVARMKELGFLQMHRAEEMELLQRVLEEASMPDKGEKR